MGNSIQLKKKLPTILFFVGVMIQLAALFGEHASEIPFMLKLISPSYYHASRGLKQIMHGRTLTRDDEGLLVMEPFLLKEWRQRNHVLPKFSDVRIEKLWFLPQGTVARSEERR